MLIINLSWFWSVRPILFRCQAQNTKGGQRTSSAEHRTSEPGHHHRTPPPDGGTGHHHPFTIFRHIPHAGACLSALLSFITCAISVHLPKVRSFPRLSSAFRRWAQQHRLSRPFALSFRRPLSWQPSACPVTATLRHRCPPSPPHLTPVSKTPFPKMFIFS